MRSTWLTSAVLLGVGFVATSASAQGGPAWLSDRESGEGIGIRVGRFVLHPGVAAEIGYDSNFFRRSGDTITLGGEVASADAPIVSAWRLRVTPSVTLSNEASASDDGLSAGIPPKLLLRANTFATYNEMLAASGASTSTSDQRRLDVGLGLNLNILPERMWGGDASADYLRVSEPSGSDDPLLGWERASTGLGGGISWRPLGGMLRWRLGYAFRYSWFRDTFRYLNNFEQSINTRGSFRFLPRTAFLYDGQYSFLRYEQSASDQNPADWIRTRLGLSSLFTNHFSLLTTVGWAASFYEPIGNTEVHNYDGLTATAALTYFLQPQPKLQPGDAAAGLSSVSAGVVRDYHNSYLSDYFASTRFYAGSHYLVGGRVAIDAQFGMSVINYVPFTLRGQRVDPDTERRLDARAISEYRITETLGAILTLQYDASLSDVTVIVPASPGDPNSRPFGDNLAYSRFQVWLGGRWFM